MVSAFLSLFLLSTYTRSILPLSCSIHDIIPSHDFGLLRVHSPVISKSFTLVPRILHLIVLRTQTAVSTFLYFSAYLIPRNSVESFYTIPKNAGQSRRPVLPYRRSSAPPWSLWTRGKHVNHGILGSQQIVATDSVSLTIVNAPADI